ncbi:MAG: hypothetical protein ACKOZW_00835 [Cyanobium sp.]
MQSSFPPEDLDLAGVCQGVAVGMLVAFLAIQMKVLLPPALAQPTWQLQLGDSLRGTASVPLVATALLLFAQRLDPEAEAIERRVTLVRRLCLAVALGFLLLIPLQISAGTSQMAQASSGESRQLREIQRTSLAIEQAQTPDALNQAIAQLPGLPSNFSGTFTRPIAEVRTILLNQIRPQIRTLETRITQARSDRMQAALRLFIFDGITALGYAIGFAAIGRSADDMPTLLQLSLWLPDELRARLLSSRQGARERGPVSEQWITTLSDEENGEAPPEAEGPHGLQDPQAHPPGGPDGPGPLG